MKTGGAHVIERQRCDVCGQRSLQRRVQLYEYQISHDGRPPVTIRVPDLEVIVCTNPDCRPEHPHDTMILDDDATLRLTTETYRQLGLLTPDEIREGRSRLGLTQRQMQDLLGLGGNSLSRWESGHIYQSRALDRFLRVFFGCEQVRHTLESREWEPFESTSDALVILDRITRDDPAVRDGIEEANLNAQIAETICEVRTHAGLTQQQLAERVGTTQSVIARLEDADYEGHSLTMLRRIATSLGLSVKISIAPIHHELECNNAPSKCFPHLVNRGRPMPGEVPPSRILVPAA